MAQINSADINKRISEDPCGFISECEGDYHAHIAALADRIVGDGAVRIALIAGPSGSGKTTTANLLSDAIIARGEESIVISLDDFYRDHADPEYPRTQDGALDFESVYALDLPTLTATLGDIAAGRPFSVPRYDFRAARRTEYRHFPAMPHSCVIIEGLHALCPLVFGHLPHGSDLKVFISVSTNIDKDGVRILSGRKIRFLRRMTRDSIYRGADARRTLSLWRGVLLGEDRYLYPNRGYADVTFDTFHAFELSVMRPYAEALISDALAAEDAYAATVRAAVRCITPLSPDLVPHGSLIREFISGGKYEDKY